MTVGATTNMGYGAMGMNGLGYNDPYFIQAYNSPNSNHQLAQQQAQMAQQAQAQMAAQSATPTAGANPSFQGGATQAIQTEAKEEKGSSVGKWILGIAAVAGLAWGGYKCFTKGNGEGLAKLWDGAKQYWDDGCKWVKGLFGKSADKADDVAAAVTHNTNPVPLVAGGEPRTQEFVQTVEKCHVAYARNIDEAAQKIDESTTGLTHLYNQRKYEALWGEKATT